MNRQMQIANCKLPNVTSPKRRWEEREQARSEADWERYCKVQSAKRKARNRLWATVIDFLILLFAICTLQFAISCACGQTLVDFSAAWCGPCQSMRPVIDQLRGEGLHVRLIDVDQQPELARQYRVTGLPTFVALDEAGCETGRIVGATSIEQLRGLLMEPGAGSAGSWEQGANQQSGGLYIAPLEPQDPWPDERLVKVRNYNPQRGEYCYLSGALIDLGGAKYVLTCSHGLAGVGDPVLVIFSDGRSTAVADCVAAEPPIEAGGADCAVLRLRTAGQHQAFVVAEAEPQLGQSIWLAGFTEAQALRAGNSRVIEWESEGVMLARGGAYHGESGGPVTNDRGQIVGVIHSTDGATTSCCRLAPIRRMFDRLFPNRPGAIIPHADAPRSEPPTPPSKSEGGAEPAAPLAPVLPAPSPTPLLPYSPTPPLPPVPLPPPEIPPLKLPPPEAAPSWQPRVPSADASASPMSFFARAARWLAANGLPLALGVPSGAGAVGLAWWLARRTVRRALPRDTQGDGGRFIEIERPQRTQKVVVTDSPPPPQRVVPRVEFAPYETDTFARADAQTQQKYIQKYPGAIATIQAYVGMRDQIYSAMTVR